MTSAEGNNGNKPLGLWNVVSIGIGATVGAGILVLLGQVVLLIEASIWVVLALGGIVAMFSGYAHARLGTSYPSNDGIIDFFRRGLGNGVFSLALSLLYPLTLVISIAMVARALGAYTVQFLYEGNQEKYLVLFYALGIAAVMTLLNSLSNHAVGRLEVISVSIRMMILLLLIIIGVWSLRPTYISVFVPPSSSAFFSCIGITLLAYAGFGMMANAADKMKDPQVIMPRMFLMVIGVITLLHISLVLVLLSDISALELKKYADAAVAQTASPLFGHVGYVIVVIGALLATASAISANLFAVFNIMGNMGSEHELPKLVNKSLWQQSTWGNIIVVVLIMPMTTAPNSGSLASVASATFLIYYLAVFAVATRLRRDIRASLLILIIGALVMLLVIVDFIYNLQPQGSHALIWIIGSLLFSLIVVMAMKRNRTIQHPSVRSTSCIIVVAVDIRTGEKACLNIC